MSDLIERQAAIEVIDAVFPTDPMQSVYAQGIALGAALAKTYVEQLPSARPEVRTDMSSADNLISRQAAIELIERMKPYHQDADDIAEMIANMPSAQPEIIRCKDCRWWDNFGDYDNDYCMAAKHGYWSSHWEISIRRVYKGDFYCADAEPKWEQE